MAKSVTARLKLEETAIQRRMASRKWQKRKLPKWQEEGGYPVPSVLGLSPEEMLVKAKASPTPPTPKDTEDSKS